MNTDLDKYLAVTPAELQRVAGEYFLPQHATVLTMLPTAPSRPAGGPGAPGGGPPQP